MALSKINVDLKKFWEDYPVMYEIFTTSDTKEDARNKLYTYIRNFWDKINRNYDIHLSLDLDIQVNAIRTLSSIISVRSEKLTDNNLISLLWDLAHGNYSLLPSDLKKGFFEELTHLLNAINNKSNIYNTDEQPDFLKKTGREASILRSEYLNEIAQRTTKYIKKYPSGLDEEVEVVRKQNKERILSALGGTPEDWYDYSWQLKNVIRNADTLKKLVDLSKEEKKAIDKAKKIGLPFGITPYYVSLMDKESSRKNDHAVRAQVIPPLHYVNTMEKYRNDVEHSADFMMERDTSPIDLVTRRYPNIAIFKPYNTCSQICVYCQRNWQITDVLDPNAMAHQEVIENAYKWFEDNPEVDEILVTGGDPLIISTDKLDAILSRLSKMEHIKRIRIGSRTPVVLPQRIDDELADMIARYHIPGKREVAIVTHFEHVYEISSDSMRAVQMFKKRGMSVYNQVVFTIENSRKFELVALRFALRAIGIDSYYVFNTKGKEETSNYRVPITRLMQEIMEEARLVPGIVRTDEAVYNVPRLGKNYIRADQNHVLLTILPDGRRVYEFHPWEKKLAHMNTYIDTDVSISDYLEELKKRGEDIDDYKSIWYYY